MHVLLASDDELEAECQEAVAMNRCKDSAERRCSSTSSSRTSHVLDVGDWAIGKTIMIAWPR